VSIFTRTPTMRLEPASYLCRRQIRNQQPPIWNEFKIPNSNHR
jgi:hypothetical protein